MLAIALVLEGRSREDAAASCGMDRQTLRDWAHRNNAEGLAGLADLPRRNGTVKLTHESQPWCNFGLPGYRSTDTKLRLPSTCQEYNCEIMFDVRSG